MESEVAALRQQIAEICIAMYRGFSDYGIVGTHGAITHKYEILGETQKRLAQHVGKEQAIREVVDALQCGEEHVAGSGMENSASAYPPSDSNR